MSNYTWFSSCGRLELDIDLDDAQSCSHQGDCELDVMELMVSERIQVQTNRWSPEILAAHLKEYGAWDDQELSDHEANIKRQLWIACCDVEEDPDTYRNEA